MIRLYHRYAELIDAFTRGGYDVASVRGAATTPADSPTLILRHDVEWDASRALTVADIEERLGVRSTMYFRVDTRALNLNVMRHLQARGFDIGYHYNTLDRCGGDFSAARGMFQRELALLRDFGLDVVSAVPHGDPSARRSGYRFNSDLMQWDPTLANDCGLLDIGPFGNRFPQRGRTYQVTDANMRWNVGEIRPAFLFRVARERTISPILLLTHVDYWSASFARAASLHLGAMAFRVLRLRAAAPRYDAIMKARARRGVVGIHASRPARTA